MNHSEMNESQSENNDAKRNGGRNEDKQDKQATKPRETQRRMSPNKGNTQMPNGKAQMSKMSKGNSKTLKHGKS